MMRFFLVIYFLAVIFLAKKNIRLATAWLILTLPTYLLRFKIGPLPTTLLEITWGGLAVAWLLFYAKTSWPLLRSFIREHLFFIGATGVFLLSSVASIFVSDMAIASLGQWRAYFLEPVILFFILISIRDRISGSELVWWLALSSLSISLYAIVQHFTGWGIATAEWTNPATRRVTAFFSSPNAVALYLGPIVMLGLGHFVSIRNKMKPESLKAGDVKNLGCRPLVDKYGIWNLEAVVILGVLVAAVLAILFTKSQGGYMALALGGALFIYLIGYKKIVLVTTIIAVIAAGTLVFFPRVLPLHYKSGGNRLTLWTYSVKYLTESPQQFVFGTGIRQFFRKIQKPFYNPKQLERLIYPHNIFLNFWTEIGFFGLVGWLGILGNLLSVSYHVYREADKIRGAALLAALVAIVVHGLIDVPYFKNDLAMEWWIVSAIIFNFKFAISKQFSRK